MTFKRYIGLFLLGLVFLVDTVQAQNLPSACGYGKTRYRMRGKPGSSFVWTVTGGSQIATYGLGDSIDVKWNNLKGTHTLICQEFIKNGCGAEPVTVPVNVITPQVDLGPVKYICKGDMVQLNAGNGFTTYQWQDGSGSSTFTATTPGTYWVEVGQGKCRVRDSIQLVEVAAPLVNLGSDTSICAPDRVLLDAGTDGISYQWSTGSRSQTIWADEGEGLIWVKVTNDNNCSTVDSIKILPCSPLKYLLVPNVFTPNGDGENDVWRIGGLQYFSQTIVKIFDRWGRVIFVSEPGYPKPWNGELNGTKLPMDAYYYVIDLKNGGKLLRGSVTIVR